jgi:hypothetical protein
MSEKQGKTSKLLVERPITSLASAMFPLLLSFVCISRIIESTLIQSIILMRIYKHFFLWGGWILLFKGVIRLNTEIFVVVGIYGRLQRVTRLWLYLSVSQALGIAELN